MTDKPTDKPVRTMLNTAQIFAAGKLIEANTIDAGNGYFVYAEGWNDAKVAQLIATPERGATADNIKNVREQTRGKFPPPTAFDRFDEMAAFLERVVAAQRATEEQLRALALGHGKLTGRVSDLEKQLEICAEKLDTVGKTSANMTQTTNDRIDHAFREIKSLTCQLTQIRDRFTKLVDRLSVDRVADVHHLRMANGNTPSAPIATQ
jgi:hypothetical protein